MKNRQKLIKLAGSFQLGWKVVKEYELNLIAADSDEENVPSPNESGKEGKRRQVFKTKDLQICAIL